MAIPAIEPGTLEHRQNDALELWNLGTLELMEVREG
jgi:hypothetical protein